MNFFHLLYEGVVLNFVHQTAQIGSVAVLDLFDKLIGKEEREVAVVNCRVGFHGSQHTIPKLGFRTF